MSTFIVTIGDSVPWGKVSGWSTMGSGSSNSLPLARGV